MLFYMDSKGRSAVEIDLDRHPGLKQCIFVNNSSYSEWGGVIWREKRSALKPPDKYSILGHDNASIFPFIGNLDEETFAWDEWYN